MNNLSLKLKGMSCASCANNIEQAILAVGGVIDCHVNFGAEQVTINYEPKQTNLAKIQAAIVDAGYSSFQLETEGVQGIVYDQLVQVGTQRWFTELGIDTDVLEPHQTIWENEGKTVIWLAVNGKSEAIMAITDALKPSSLTAVKALQKLGLEVVMLTGDNQKTAQTVANQVGITQVFAQVRPDQKAAMIKSLQQKKVGNKFKIVAMVGDGINDAPALAQADVGIAMGTGTDVAIAASDITLISGDLQAIVTAIQLSRATINNIRQNLFFAFIYNIIGIPIAAGILYPFFGLLLNPIIAGAAMAFSSVSVVSNALRLRNFQPGVR
jgi:Cu+-exporting ATPase